MIHHLAEKRVTLTVRVPTEEEILELKKKAACVEVTEHPGFVMGHDYFNMKLPGAINRVFCRAALLDRMKVLAKQLAPDYGIYFFDVFRTKATQKFLFDDCRERLKLQHPEFTEEQLELETRKYVSHPDEPKRFTAPPHNTGGAIDLALVNLKTRKIVNFGSPIDLSEEISATDFFEKQFDPNMGLSEAVWLEARKHRRILFHSMVQLGFTNYPSEWWHYDLGDGMWAHALGKETIYHSMEKEVQEILRNTAGSSCATSEARCAFGTGL